VHDLGFFKANEMIGPRCLEDRNTIIARLARFGADLHALPVQRAVFFPYDNGDIGKVIIDLD